MMKNYFRSCLLVFGLFSCSSYLYGQSELKNLEQVQFLSQGEGFNEEINSRVIIVRKSI